MDASKATENVAIDYEAVVKSFEPNWLTGDLGNYPCDEPETAGERLSAKEGIYQQSDLLKPMLDDVVKYGLNYTYQKYGASMPLHGMAKKQEPVKYSKTSNKKHIIIVGAGAAGLSAAYELTKAGHEVDILEMQNRVGGRVKTLREKDGFSKYCHSEAGAMRLPKRPDAPNKTHFLTDYYAAEEFKLKLVPFTNYDKKAWYKFYDKDKIRVSDWENNSTYYCNEFWNGWDSKIKGNDKVHVKDIEEYYKQTTEIVTNQLISKLNSIQCENQQEREKCMAKVWNAWINNWCKFSLMGFLQNTKDGVLQLLDKEHQLDKEAADKLDALIPWPDTAITAYTVFTYTTQLDLSLVVLLRDQLGDWWSKHMHCIEDGMHRLPEAFIEERESPWPDHMKINLEEKITYHVKVDEVVYTATNPHNFQNLKVKVKGKYVSSGQPFEIEGDAVIITAPLNIVRQIQFVPAKGTTSAKKLTDMYKALEDIFQSPATKIMLQYKERFWEKEPDSIHGGFSKTSMPIGQLHYPSDSDVKTKRGILMSYTWKSEALMFAALKPADAVREAVKEVARIHPNSEKYFEVGEVQAWSNDPHSQGAYALLKPHQYSNVHFLMTNPCLNMFFAGDGISFAAGWIQGALESGLRAAYQFYCRNEKTSSLS